MIDLIESYIDYLKESLTEYVIEGLDCATGYILIIKDQLQQTIKK